jgi:hypothetical protein
MFVVLAASVLVVVPAILAYAVWRLGGILERQRRDAAIQQLLAIFGPATAASQQDPRQLLVWYPFAQNSRKLFPDAFAELDKACGSTFPFTKEQVKAAHARCSSDWLAWEQAHDAEYSMKAAQAEHEIARAGGQTTPLLRTRLAAVEREKLERYQQRYEEYIKTAKALAAFVE